MTGTNEPNRRKRYSRVRIDASVHVNAYDGQDVAIPDVRITVDGLDVTAENESHRLYTLQDSISRKLAEFATYAIANGRAIKEYRIP